MGMKFQTRGDCLIKKKIYLEATFVTNYGPVEKHGRASSRRRLKCVVGTLRCYFKPKDRRRGFSSNVKTKKVKSQGGLAQFSRDNREILQGKYKKKDTVMHMGRLESKWAFLLGPCLSVAEKEALRGSSSKKDTGIVPMVAEMAIVCNLGVVCCLVKRENSSLKEKSGWKGLLCEGVDAFERAQERRSVCTL